ncbi:MAG: M6 family metalloprotease domain-containing protein [Muribaculaceae bacterium]|nr:M6 family metalloprotease domain-containing protein [Muribaculaceae bacterium]
MKVIYTFALCGVLTACSLTAHGARPQRAPGLERRAAMQKIDKLGNSKFDNSDGHDLREVNTQGELRIPAILVDFADQKFSVSDDPRLTIDNMLNLPGFTEAGATGSAYDFFHTTSFGQFSPVFDVYGPVQLDRNEVEYVQSDETYIGEDGKEKAVYPAGRMVEEAVRKLDGEVDFSKYDANGDGMVDFVYIFFAGKGATTGGDRNSTIWPHAYTLTSAIGGPIVLDGVKIDRYATSGERGSNGRLSGIGTFCHEFSHVLGLPDLYDTSNNGTVSKCFTPGPYSCMDSGNYNNSEHTPPMFSAYERYALEWLLPVTITGGGEFTLLPSEARNFAYKIPSATRPKEYFLFESRGTGYYDGYLPAAGMAVWHIDFDETIWADNRPNNEPSRQRIDLVEADNDPSNSSRGGDLFPGAATVCEYQSSVSPAFLGWDNKSTGFEISDIRRHPDGCVTMRVTADSGKEMAGTAIAAPQVKVASVGGGKVTLEWPVAEGAERYRVSVYEAGSFDGANIGKFADGLWFADITDEVLLDFDGVCHLTLDGLNPSTSYAAVVYAENDLNAARSEATEIFRTHGTDVADTFVALRAGRTGEPGEVTLSWDAVDGEGVYYEAQVAQGAPVEIIGHDNVGFDGSRLPEGWSGTGKYDTRDNYSGESAPSYTLTGAGGWLQTSRYEGSIASISFWSRQRFSGAAALLDIYEVLPDGILRHIERLTDFTNKGARYTINLPDYVSQVKMVLTPLATSLDLYIDDMELTLASEPMMAEALRQYGADTSWSFDVREKGIDPSQRLYARVRPVGPGDEKGLWSEILAFVPAELPWQSGVQSIGADSALTGVGVADGVLVTADSDMIYDLYTAEGRAVALGARGSMPLPGKGLYIVRTAGASAKVMW